MNWREVIIVKILLLISIIVSDDPTLERELKNLSNSISTRIST